MKFREFGSII